MKIGSGLDYKSKFTGGLTINPQVPHQSASGNDPDAIHWNISSEFAPIQLESQLDNQDVLLGESLSTGGSKIKL